LKISRIVAREVLDSRGRPTVEAEVHMDSGAWGRAIVPSGASTGRHEALELRDGDSRRYGGAGVRRAVDHVMRRIAPALVGPDWNNQGFLDAHLLEMDGTADKHNLGANALLSVSLAFAHAAAAANGVRLYQYFAQLTGRSPSMPLPMVNILSGGLHAGRQIDFQDFLAVPLGASSYTQALEWIHEIYQAALRRCVAMGYNPQLVADEGGLAPNVAGNEAALELLTGAIADAGLASDNQVGIAIDVAATHFWRNGEYVLNADQKRLTSAKMVEYLEQLAGRYPVVSLEDGLAEDDWEGWQHLTTRLGGRLQVLGDDLFVTNCTRLEQGISRGVANAILIKYNQVGTVSEALAAVAVAREGGYRTVVSARSGETEDTTMADLAAGIDAGQIKIGSVTRSSRLAKYNQLLRIGEDTSVRHWAPSQLFPGSQIS
jgi:enolase